MIEGLLSLFRLYKGLLTIAVLVFFYFRAIYWYDMITDGAVDCEKFQFQDLIPMLPPNAVVHDKSCNEGSSTRHQVTFSIPQSDLDFFQQQPPVSSINKWHTDLQQSNLPEQKQEEWIKALKKHGGTFHTLQYGQFSNDQMKTYVLIDTSYPDYLVRYYGSLVD
jgi:hypothetical protein